jgi:hypothetical protein
MDNDARVFHQMLLSFAHTGQPPTTESLANALALSREQVEQSLNLLESGGSIYRHPETGAILAAYPFSATPTQHVVHFADGHAVYAMCAIDALGMPVMLDMAATIESRCTQCGRQISVEVKNNVLAEFSPHTTRVWYMQADACCIPALQQCPSINFFCSAGHLDIWRVSHDDMPTAALTMDEAFAYGARIFGHLLKQEGQFHAL